MLLLNTQWCLRVQQSSWDVSLFAAPKKNRIDDFPLYDQYLETMACLMDDQTHLQEKEQMLFDLAVGVFSAACSPRTAKKEDVEKIGELKTILSTDLHRDFTINS